MCVCVHHELPTLDIVLKSGYYRLMNNEVNDQKELPCAFVCMSTYACGNVSLGSRFSRDL